MKKLLITFDVGLFALIGTTNADILSPRNQAIYEHLDMEEAAKPYGRVLAIATYLHHPLNSDEAFASCLK
jgi:hypothetical protein